jgi:hypothetical protein
MLSVDLVDNKTGACIENSLKRLGKTSDVVDYFIEYHHCTHSFYTSMNIQCGNVVIQETDKCMPLFAVIGRSGDAYLTHWQPEEASLRAYIRYDFEHSVTWVYMVCDYFMRLLTHSPRVFRPIQSYVQLSSIDEYVHRTPPVDCALET